MRCNGRKETQVSFSHKRKKNKQRLNGNTTGKCKKQRLKGENKSCGIKMSDAVTVTPVFVGEPAAFIAFDRHGNKSRNTQIACG